MSAAKNIEIFNQYESEWAQWRKRAIKLDNFYNNQQYSKTVASELRQVGLKPLVVPIVKPLIAQQVAILTSTKPSWRVIPLKGASREVADISQRFLVGKWNSDYIDTQLYLALLDMCKVGLGYLMIDVANFMDNAVFDILIERINWRYVYPDPRSQRFDISDAEDIILKKRAGLKRAQVVFGLSEKDIKDAVRSDGRSFISEVDILDRFSKYPVERVEYAIADEYRNELSGKELPPTVFYTSKLKSKIENESRKWYKTVKSLENDGKIELKELNELNIYRCISVGAHTAYEGIINIRDYPIIAFADEHSGDLNQTQGETATIEGIQEYVNKFYMLTIQNAMLTGNSRYMGPKDAVKDISKFQKTANIPGAYLEWIPQPDLPNYGKPERIEPGQLASAFYSLANDLIRRAEYALSIYAPVQGNPQGVPETFSTTASLQEFGTQRIKSLARRVEIMIAKAGEVVMQYIQNYTDVNELLEYVDDRQYTPDGQPNENYGNITQAGTLNELPIDEGVVREIKNDAKIGHFAVKILTQPNFGSDRQNKAAFMSNMIMNKALPATPAVLRRLLDYLEVPGYQEIVSEIASAQPNQQTIQQLIQNVKVLSKQNQLLLSESSKMAKQLEISDFSKNMYMQLADIKMKIKDEISKGSVDINSQLTDLLNSVKTNNGETNVQTG